jgi:hypothetical protein
VGTWISINPSSAVSQFSRLAAAFILYCALVESGYRVKRHAAWVLLIGGGGLALYWPLTYEFASDPGKIPPLRFIGLLINRITPDMPGMGFSSNVVGGVLAMLLPFAIAQVWISRRHKNQRQVYLAALLGLCMLGGLLLSSSRGALLGLAAAGVLAVLVLLQLRRQPDQQGKRKFWLVVGVLLVLLLSVLAMTGLLERLVGSVPDPTGSLQSRMQIWRQGWDLIGDYVYTGSGLRTFPLVFSIYRLLIHVPYHEHMHNIFLETWFEQGVLGVIAMLWGMAVVAWWAWRGLSIEVNIPKHASRSLRALGWAGMAGLVAAGVHGMVDVIFYTKRSMPLLGLVIGFAYLVYGLPVSIKVVENFSGRRVRLLTLGSAIGLLLLIVLFSRSLLAAGFANFGTLEQSWIEMRRYNPNMYDNPSLDQIRRRNDLSQVEAAYRSALELNPANRTALQRLTQIALSRGDFEEAFELMESARKAGLEDEVTRLLYGDLLVASGLPHDAVQEISDIGWASERLAFQAWFRYWRSEDYTRAEDTWQAVLILEPGNREAESWLERVQARLGAE